MCHHITLLTENSYIMVRKGNRALAKSFVNCNTLQLKGNKIACHILFLKHPLIFLKRLQSKGLLMVETSATKNATVLVLLFPL